MDALKFEFIADFHNHFLFSLNPALLIPQALLHFRHKMLSLRSPSRLVSVASGCLQTGEMFAMRSPRRRRR